MNRRCFAWLLAGVLCLNLCSCSGKQASETEQKIALPEPPEQAFEQIVGERIAPAPEQITLCYISGDGTSYSTVNRDIHVDASDNACAAAVRTLLFDSAVPEQLTFIPANTRLLNTEYACGTATINLSVDALGVQNDQDMLRLQAAVTNTTLSVDGVDAVNVLINGRSESIASLPGGVHTQPYSGIMPTYAQLSAEREYFLESGTETILRHALLYFPSDGNYLIPEIRSIEFDSDNYAAALIRELRKGPLVSDCSTQVLPEDADLLVNNPSISITSDGERILQLDFSSSLQEFLSFTGLEQWEFIGSVVLTTTSFVPGIDAVRITLDGTVITSCAGNDYEMQFQDGLIRRSDFSSYIGSTILLHLTNEDGTLTAVSRAESMAKAMSPYNVLRRLLSDSSDRNEARSIFLEGISQSDILGLKVEDGIATVNLSANFYRHAQILDDVQERGTVYAVVNTLCAMPGINGVQFCVEGNPAETLSGSIYLKGILLPNPGAVSAAQISSDATAIP